MANCTITATVILPDGSAASGVVIRVNRVYLAGNLVSKTPQTYTTNGSGIATITAPRNSIAYIYANVFGLDAKGPSGVPIAIPDTSTATLETLVPDPVIPGYYPA